MIPKNNSPKQVMSNIRIIYLALVTGLIIFMALAVNMRGNENISSPETTDILFIIDIIVNAMMLPLSFIVSNKRIDQIDRKLALSEKLNQFMQAFIIRLAILEAPALFSVIVLLLNGNISALALFALALALIGLNYPTPERIGKMLELTDEEKKQLY